MQVSRVRWLLAAAFAGATTGLALLPQASDSACCYFSAKEKDILQPSQKAFLTWDPTEKVESFTVQPKFEGNALDFGMVIPTPSRPKLDEMPRDFFKELAFYTILKKREFPQSKLMALYDQLYRRDRFKDAAKEKSKDGGPPDPRSAIPRPTTVAVLESGVVGSLDYKIITAERADDLFNWLKENKYSYAGDEATLDFYVRKKWFFTVMKIDTTQMKRNADGTFAGEVTPTRLQFTSDALVYPLKITQLSVKDKTEALFYVQAPYKVDLPGDMTYQYQWVPMLQNARGWYNKGIFGENYLPGNADQWLTALKGNVPGLIQKGNQLGFSFVSGQRPQPNRDGRIATTLEWARQLNADDVKVLRGEAPFGEKLPNVDEGFTEADLRERAKADAVVKVIAQRLEKARKERPAGYLVREAPTEELKQLKVLLGHLKEGQVITKFRKTFTRAEMNDDLVIVPAKWGEVEDRSEYTEILPTSPP